MKAPLLILSLAALSLLSACSHSPGLSTEERLDRKMATEPVAKSGRELREQADRLIRMSPALSARQRSELLELRTATSAELDRIANESLRLRAVLVKDVLARGSRKEMGLIETRLKSLEQDRLSTLFGAVHQANTMLGRWASRNERLESAVFDEMMYQMLDAN
jgi:hypothetical protein